MSAIVVVPSIPTKRPEVDVDPLIDAANLLRVAAAKLRAAGLVAHADECGEISEDIGAIMRELGERADLRMAVRS